MTDIQAKIEYVISHTSVTCGTFEKRFADKGKAWTVTPGISTFYVHDEDDVLMGSASAETVVREGIDAIVNAMIAAQEGPLPFQNGPDDLEYPTQE